MGDAIGRLFQGFIDFLNPILIPDWKALIDLLPVFLLIGVVGPIVTLLLLGWGVYILGKPRGRLPYVEPQPQPARLVDGKPVYPTGEPYCPFDQLVYPPGASTCADCKRDLAVTCPKCGTGRQAWIDTCGTCGLVLVIDRNVPALRTAPTGPPKGGAAAA